ncbi:inverse autotransporter beta domain-containing protein [Candidatus Thioglobus sp.]|nr:inverse autotransporter beta domain-containing protein [Candidatus Thioglobus sp.]
MLKVFSSTLYSQLSVLLLLALPFGASALDANQAGEQISSKVINKAVSETEGFINTQANKLANSFGEGNTEISISNVESGKPAYSIKTIQPLTSPNKDAKELIFTQGSLTSGENEGDRRTTINLGLGKRALVEEDKAIIGANVFVDYETKSKHKRASLGAEYKRSNFSAGANKYWALSDKITINGSVEEALGGHDIKLTGQAPYAPWATIKGTHYYWDQNVGNNITGNILGVEIQLSPSTSFEMGSENSNSMNRTAYAELSVKLPFDGNETLNSFQLDDAPFRVDADMSGELLAMVERSNQIKIEKTSISSSSSSSSSGMTVGGITYSTVVIGTQTWTAEHMRHDAINGNTWSYDDNVANDADGYGRLYDWVAAMEGSTTEGTQGICASGWHVPSDDDWKVLEGQLGMSTDDQDATDSRGTTEGTKLKVGGFSGFEAKLAGARYASGLSAFRGDIALFWSSTESGSDAYRRFLSTNSAKVFRGTFDKEAGFSVRCLKN